MNGTFNKIKERSCWDVEMKYSLYESDFIHLMSMRICSVAHWCQSYFKTVTKECYFSINGRKISVTVYIIELT